MMGRQDPIICRIGSQSHLNLHESLREPFFDWHFLLRNKTCSLPFGFAESIRMERPVWWRLRCWWTGLLRSQPRRADPSPDSN